MIYTDYEILQQGNLMLPLSDMVPRLSTAEAETIGREMFGVAGTASTLPSERDQNFLLTSPSGERTVLKIANAAEDLHFLDAQQQALRHLAAAGCRTPHLIPTLTGLGRAEVTAREGNSHQVWMISFIEGTPLAEIGQPSHELVRDLGRRLAEIDAALVRFDHPALHRTFHWDLAEGPRQVAEHLDQIGDDRLRSLIGRFLDRFAAGSASRLPGLRRSVITNDANDYNVIVRVPGHPFTPAREVAGLIDYGDMVHSFTIADPAVAAAYLVLDRVDPLSVAADLLRGYHEVFPMCEEELDLFWEFLCLRLCLSVALAARQRQDRPDNEYLGISQVPIARTLPRLIEIHPRLAAACLRRACGFSIPAALGKCLDRVAAVTAAVPVLGDLGSAPRVLALDLGVASPLLAGDIHQNGHPHLYRRIQAVLDEAGADFAAGLHGEARFSESGEENRVHLGVDLFATAGTPVRAPLAGIVAEKNGGSLLLRHDADNESPFYSLYKGLTAVPASLPEDGKIAAGTEIGRIGSAEENGGRPPHLHLQVITDLLDHGCDFPDRAGYGQREVWNWFSPDPLNLLGIPVDRPAAPGPDRSETLSARKRWIGGSVRLSFREPVKIVRGWMQYLFDETGRCYIDAYNNVPHVGHCHPRVVEAARKQMGLLNTNTRYLHDLITRYAESLTARFPDPLSVCFFLNSASEANELAIRLARTVTGRRDMIVLDAAYHGHTTSLIDISPYKHDGPGGQGAPGWVHKAPLADDYRGPFKRGDPEAGNKYAAQVEAITARLREQGQGVAAFIAESCPSVGGQIFFPPGYLDHVYRSIRGAGGLCIADEVQTGLGRIGTHLWAFQSQVVVPDIVVLGKPIGNGFPLAAVVTTPAIAAAFDNGMEFFSTFGGSTLSSAVGLSVLQTVLDEGLPEHARRLGDRLLAALKPFKDRFPLVGDVRGSGLFLGVELVRDRETLEPAAAEASYVVDRLREEGILMGTDGPLHNVLKIRPPMPFAEADADRLVETLERIFSREIPR